jgi:hypothetical protein
MASNSASVLVAILTVPQFSAMQAFISHNKADAETAPLFATMLTARGVSV